MLSYAATLAMWMYWRLWILPSRVLYSILFEVQRSKMYDYSCGVTDTCIYVCNDKQLCTLRVYFFEIIERTVTLPVAVFSSCLI